MFPFHFQGVTAIDEAIREIESVGFALPELKPSVGMTLASRECVENSSAKVQRPFNGRVTTL